MAKPTDDRNPDELPGADAETGLITTRVTEARSEDHRLGESATFVRNITVRAGTVAELDAAVAGLSLSMGSPHPSQPLVPLTQLSYEEDIDEGRGGGDMIVYTANIKATYELRQTENAEENEGGVGADPTTRATQYTFESSGQPVAALFYFPSEDNNAVAPMANSAGDPIKGLQVDEAIQVISIKFNRYTFPWTLAAALTNCINKNPWEGFPARTVKCQGISAQSKQELIDDVNYWYYEIEIRLMYRQTGWDLYIPDVGYNYIEGGEKKRAWVIAPDPDENGDEVKLPSADPVGLNGAGGLAGGGAPAVLTRRIYSAVDFATYF